MRILVFVLLICVAPLSHAAAEDVVFAGIKWGSTPQVVASKLKQLGFTIPYTKGADGLLTVKLDKDQIVSFKDANLDGEKAHIVAVFSKDNRLLKVAVYLLTADKDAISKYNEMKKVLIKKYGQPDRDVAQFTSPYYEGDGYEQSAIKLGKAKIVAIWMPCLVLEITDMLTVRIGYESPEWEAEVVRRREEASAPF